MKKSKSYSELITLPTYEDRLNYLKLDGVVAEETFGSKRWMNQTLYRSKEWYDFRNQVIIRDCGCDLGLEGYDICDHIIIHHINPISDEDIRNRASCIFDLDNVICTSLQTHNAIHYRSDYRPNEFTERRPNDTCPWKGDN